MKYKVGDKVRVRKDLRADYYKVYLMEDKSFGDTFVSGMSHLVGKVVTIKTADGKYTIEECGYNWTDEMFEPVNEHKIVITTDGTETLARLYDGNKVIKSATAKCSPDDTFDFNTGAKLAFDRLIGEEKKEQEWRVVNRPAKKGDFIRLKRNSFSFSSKGDILKVHSANTGFVSVLARDHKRNTNMRPDYEWNYGAHEFEVVEPCEKTEKPETPKCYNGEVVCIKTSYPWWTVGKVYPVVNGKIKDDRGKVYPVRDGDEYKDAEDVRHAGDAEEKRRHNPNNEFIPFVE